jgi:hypothetical protein
MLAHFSLKALVTFSTRLECAQHFESHQTAMWVYRLPHVGIPAASYFATERIAVDRWLWIGHGSMILRVPRLAVP